MAFNLFRKSKKPETDTTLEKSESSTLQTSESGEDSKLLESQLEALGQASEEINKEEKDDIGTGKTEEVVQEKDPEDIPKLPVTMESGEGKEEFKPESAAPEGGEPRPDLSGRVMNPTTPREAGPESKEPYSIEKEKGKEESIKEETRPVQEERETTLLSEGPKEVPAKKIIPEAPAIEEKPETEESKTEIPSVVTPPASEEIQKDADAVSTEFGGGGGVPKFVRIGLVIVLVASILVGGAFVYSQFFGGSLQLSFLKNIPYVGTYFEAPEVAPSVSPTPSPEVPVPVPLPTPTPTPTPTPSPIPELIEQEMRDNTRISDINTIASALAAYYEDFGSYPNTGVAVDKLAQDTVLTSLLYTELVPIYIGEFFADPDPNFYYGYMSGGSSYELTSIIENKDHVECVLTGTYCIRKIEDGEVVSIK